MVKFYGKRASFAALLVSTNDKLSDFYTSSWQQGESAVPMFVVRILLSALALAIFVWSIVEASSLHLLIYLTNWGVLLVLATTVSGLAISCLAVCKKPSETKELPWHVSLYWVFFNMSVSISVMITALYWILLYNPAQREELGPRLFMLDITKHGITACVVMAELLISRTPVWLAHVYQPLCIGVTYSIFTGMYYIAGGTDSRGNVYIYHVLNWQQAQQAGIVVLGAITGLVVFYFILWNVAICRNKISIALVRAQKQEDQSAPNQGKLQTV